MLNKTLRNQWEPADGAWRLVMPDNWMQGRSCFGGLTASVAVGLARNVTQTDRALQSFNVQLLRPVLPGGVRGDVAVNRDGKNVMFVETRLSQNDETVAIVNAVFTTHRESEISIFPEAPVFEKKPDDLEALPYIADVTPQFVQNVSMKWAEGDFPFSGSETAKFGGYCRFNDPAGDDEGLVALLDVWPCPSLALVSKPVFASTVFWTGHIARAPETFDQWFKFTYETISGNEGYHSVKGELFSERGEFLAWTEQLVAVFE